MTCLKRLVEPISSWVYPFDRAPRHVVAVQYDCYLQTGGGTQHIATLISYGMLLLRISQYVRSVCVSKNSLDRRFEAEVACPQREFDVQRLVAEHRSIEIDRE